MNDVNLKYNYTNLLSYLFMISVVIYLEICFFTKLPKNSVGLVFFVFAIAIILFLYVIVSGFKIRLLSKKNTVLLLLSLFMVFIGYTYNGYNIVLITTHLLLGWGVYVFFDIGYKNIKIDVMEKVNNFFYVLFLCSIIYCMVFYHSYDLGGNMFFDPIGDQNWTGVLIFLFFAYSWNFKRIIGGLVCFIYVMFISDSRGLLLMITAFGMCKVLKKYMVFILKNKLFNKIYKIHFISTLLVVILSFYWIISVVVGGLDGYREGLNDGSNQMRFMANVFAVSDLYNTPRLIFCGYDVDLKKQWGIIDDELDITARTDDGIVLVQPHNGVINLCVTLGIIPAILYLYMFSSVLDKLNYNNNIELIIPYIINAAFLHMYSIHWLLLWIFIIILNTTINNANTSGEIRL